MNPLRRKIGKVACDELFDVQLFLEYARFLEFRGDGSECAIRTVLISAKALAPKSRALISVVLMRCLKFIIAASFLEAECCLENVAGLISAMSSVFNIGVKRQIDVLVNVVRNAGPERNVGSSCSGFGFVFVL